MHIRRPPLWAAQPRSLPDLRNLGVGVSTPFAQVQLTYLAALASRDMSDGDVIAALTLHAGQIAQGNRRNDTCLSARSSVDCRQGSGPAAVAAGSCCGAQTLQGFGLLGGFRQDHVERMPGPVRRLP